MACAVLAVQGAFIEHEQRLLELGEDCIELRQAADLARPFDRLVLPGANPPCRASFWRSSVCSRACVPA